MLTECSLVVMSSELGAVSSFVMSLKSMLCPLAWQGSCYCCLHAAFSCCFWLGMFVPVLPERLHCFLDAPVPLIVGAPAYRVCSTRAAAPELQHQSCSTRALLVVSGVHGMPSVALNSHHVYLSLDSDMLQTSTDILPLVNQAPSLTLCNSLLCNSLLCSPSAAHSGPQEKLIARLRPFHQKLQKCAPEYGSPKHKRFTQVRIAVLKARH